MKEAARARVRVLRVRKGVVVPPKVLRTLLPDVASVVTNAMTAGTSKQTQPSTSDPQETDTSTLRIQKIITNPFPCNICKLRFPSRQHLNIHQLSHEHECQICKIPFGSRQLLLKHKCCICKICNKPSASANHRNCPRFLICKCGEKFTRKRDFATHQKLHTDIYGHCPTCGRQFTNETDLVNHVDKMKFPCIYCGSCFADLEELSEHSIEHPEPPGYTCEICKETFEDSFAATSHSRTHKAPLKSYSRKSKPPPPVLEIVKIKEEALEVPVEFEGETKETDKERRLFAKVKDEPCDRLDDLECLEETAPRLEVKVEFEEEMRELNEEGPGKQSNLVTDEKGGPVVYDPCLVKLEPVQSEDSEAFHNKPCLTSLKREDV